MPRARSLSRFQTHAGPPRDASSASAEHACETVHGVTETAPLTPSEPTQGAIAERSDLPEVNVTRLLAEAASKSRVAWIRLPDGTTHPIWFAWHDDQDPRGTGPALYVVSGPGEQPLPWLPDDVDVIFRSKVDKGRLLTVQARVREIRPDDPQWSAAVAVLKSERLNSTGDIETRWLRSATIHVLAPYGRPRVPSADGSGSGRAVLTPAPTVTARWRPWHWRGRPQSRRGTT